MKAFVTVKLVSNIITVFTVSCQLLLLKKSVQQQRSQVSDVFVCFLIQNPKKLRYLLTISLHTPAAVWKRTHTFRIGFHFPPSVRLLNSSLALRRETQSTILNTLMRLQAAQKPRRHFQLSFFLSSYKLLIQNILHTSKARSKS